MQQSKLNVQTLLAPNPGPMTGAGTNTYILGRDEVLIVDPGPMDAAHQQTIVDAVADATCVIGIFVTHAHLDHTPLSRSLADHFDCPVIGSGPPSFGRSDMMQDLAAQAVLGGGEGVDPSFQPEICLGENDPLEIDGCLATAILTPGHFCNHISLAFDDTILVGDHVMDWTSTLISPPDGDLGAFRATSHKLLARAETLYLAGHGGPMANGPARLREMLNHRDMRETQILQALAHTKMTPLEIAQTIYIDIAEHLIPAATRNVLAHLIDLIERGMIQPQGALSNTAKFEKI